MRRSSAPKGTIHNDEATTNDRLNRSQYAQAFARVAEQCDTPLVIGLYGGWGVGKTSLMKLIEEKLDAARTRTVWFDVWRQQFDESAALALVHTVIDRFGMQQEAKKLVTVIAAAFGSMMLKATTAHTLSLKDIDELGRRFEEEHFQVREARTRLHQHFRQLIEKAQGKPKRRIVFFIDDLDRCMPPQILSMLESLKLYLNLPGCVYFVGVDRHALERSIQYHYKGLELSEISYLDKVVQLPFTIPPIAPESMVSFVDPLLSESLKPCQGLLMKGLGSNPREIKRFINTLTLNHQLASGLHIPGYDPTVLALLLLIQYRNPGLYRLLARQPTLLREFRTESEEAKSLREEYLARDEQLGEVLASVEVPGDAPVERYVYLTQVASVGEEVETAGRESQLTDILLAHAQWLKSEGKEGKHAKLSWAKLTGALLRGASLSKANLSEANLRRADLRLADMSGADLSGANLSGADLSPANLSEADLSRAGLLGAKLREANLRGADLCGADLRGADLRGANLREANLGAANLRMANLRDAKNLTEEQLASVETDEMSVLPDGSKGPFRRGSGAHLPGSPQPEEKRTRRTESWKVER